MWFEVFEVFFSVNFVSVFLFIFKVDGSVIMKRKVLGGSG